MTINPEYLKLFVNATEMAAYGAYKFIGKNDKIAADQAAVDEMRKELNKIIIKVISISPIHNM